MAYDLTSIPLNEKAFAAASEILESFYAGGSDLNSPKLLELEVAHGITFAEAADALNAHLIYTKSHEAVD
jgi:hypothetical protein